MSSSRFTRLIAYLQEQEDQLRTQIARIDRDLS